MPFALAKGDERRDSLKPYAPATYGSVEYTRQARELADLSANLTGVQKTVAEYWLDGPNSEQPPGHKREEHLHVVVERSMVARGDPLGEEHPPGGKNARPARGRPSLGQGAELLRWKCDSRVKLARRSR